MAIPSVGHLFLVVSTALPVLCPAGGELTSSDVLLGSGTKSPASPRRVAGRTRATLVAGGYFFLQDRRTRRLVSRRIEGLARGDSGSPGRARPLRHSQRSEHDSRLERCGPRHGRTL